ncbi:Dyp-type peroxidase [Microbacterium deminutum]|uniref:Iron uptake transporter deferrochelatase/peroxidase subunit n=1 Tax=Microbacterium deminutum TaxID=344164 RepID=A0ABP5BZ59_9MICO
MTAHQPDSHEISRRTLLFSTGAGALAVGAAGVAGYAVGSRTTDGPASAEPTVAAAGDHQAGISRPAVPQRHCLVSVGTLTSVDLQSSLHALGIAIARLTNPDDPVQDITPDGPGNLTITVGLGSAMLARTSQPGVADAVALPVFRGDDKLPSARRGGDILLSVNADDPMILEPIQAELTAAIDGFTPKWSELGFRGRAADGVARNPLGYLDGIIRPHTPEQLDSNVWIRNGPLAGGTICVIRRFQLDIAAFRELPKRSRDQIIGRHQSDGSPLSGGTRDDHIDLGAKTAAGELLVPAHAHARAAHPSFTGSALMLRRSYGYRASAADHGHLFISYQNDVQTFARTQLRLDDIDDLMMYVSPTATASFAILPGFDTDQPLGAPLF